MTESLSGITLKQRYAEYLASPKDNLRARLIDAVSQHEGWEEFAIALVDEAIMTVISRHSSPMDDSLIELFRKEAIEFPDGSGTKFLALADIESIVRQQQAEHLGDSTEKLCPYIVTGKGGTSFCRLAQENGVPKEQPVELSVSDIQNAIQSAKPERIIVRQELRQRDGEPIEVLHEKTEYKVTAWNQALAVIEVIKPYLRQPERESSAQHSVAPVGDDVERIARAIRPEAFERWDEKVLYHTKNQGSDEEAKIFAEWCDNGMHPLATVKQARLDAKAALSAMPDNTALIRWLVETLQIIGPYLKLPLSIRDGDEYRYALVAGQAYLKQQDLDEQGRRG